MVGRVRYKGCGMPTTPLHPLGEGRRRGLPLSERNLLLLLELSACCLFPSFFKSILRIRLRSRNKLAVLFWIDLCCCYLSCLVVFVIFWRKKYTFRANLIDKLQLHFNLCGKNPLFPTYLLGQRYVALPCCHAYDIFRGARPVLFVPMACLLYNSPCERFPIKPFLQQILM